MSQTGLMNSRQSQLEASAEEEWSKKKKGILSDDDASWASVCCVCLSSSLSLSLSLLSTRFAVGPWVRKPHRRDAGSRWRETPSSQHPRQPDRVVFPRIRSRTVVISTGYTVTGVVVSSKYLLHDQ